MIKKLVRSKLFWFIVIILIIAVIIAANILMRGGQIEYSTQPAAINNIIQSVSATGSIKAVTSIDLNFETSGRIIETKASVGDEVKAGQVLARLEGSALAVNVAKAEANLAASRADLERLKAGATKEDVATLEATVAKNETEIKNAEQDLIETKNLYGQSLINNRESALNETISDITKAEITLQTIYDAIYYKGNSDDFKTSTELKTNLINDYDQSKSILPTVKSDYIQAVSDKTDANIDKSINSTLDILNKIRLILNDLAYALDQAITHGNMTQTDVDTLKAAVNTRRTTTDSSKDSLETARQDLLDARITYDNKVSDAEQAIAVAERTLDKSKADLALKKAPPRAEDILWYEAKVKQTQAELAYAVNKYNETILKAPVDGMIIDKNHDVGEFVGSVSGSSDAVYKLQGKGNYEIEVDIPESDITKIKIGESVDIVLDAFSGQDIFKGAVIKIDPAQTEIQGVIYYKIAVIFIDTQPTAVEGLRSTIKPGMTANITVITATRENVIIIPQRAVKEVEGKKVVQVLSNGQVFDREVIAGLKGSDGNIEIVSGLQAGEKVVTFIKNK